MKTNKTKNLTFTLYPQDIAKIEEIQHLEGNSRSEVVRAAVYTHYGRYFEKRGENEKKQ